MTEQEVCELEEFDNETDLTRALYGSELTINYSKRMPKHVLMQLKAFWLKECAEGHDPGLDLFYSACGLFMRALSVASTEEHASRAYARLNYFHHLRRLRKTVDHQFPNLTKDNKPKKAAQKYPAICPACNIHYKHWIHFAQHVRSFHSKSEKKEARCWCGKLYATERGLAQHLNRQKDLREHYRSSTVLNVLTNQENTDG